MYIYPYVIVTAVWILVTTIIIIWATRIYINAAFATTFGRLKDSRAAKGRRHPKVTVLLPLYNEHKVIDRLMEHITAMDYPNFKVIIADDSTDSITLRMAKKWERDERVSVVHRKDRTGFKAGALNNAIRFADPDSEYFAVFDADYVPGPGTIQKMVNHFLSGDTAVVQGYTEQTLNSGKNILTKSVSTGFSSYCLVDVASRKRLNGFIPIFGTVFMIRRKALEDVGGFNEASITEDWDLATKLMRRGHRVVFDESIRVSGECPETFRSLAKQQIRWAEGITRDTKRNLLRVLASRRVNILQKIDYIYYGFSSFNCVLGSVSYGIAISAFLIGFGIISGPQVDKGLVLWFGQYGSFALFAAPFYIPLALILASVIGLYREGRIRNAHWSIYMVLVNSLLVPFIAFGSLRGLIFSKGSWSRTPKTGSVSLPAHGAH